MNTIYQFISKEIVEAIGWTLFHSIWQIAVVALGLGIILLIFSKFSATARYFISFIALGFIVVWVSITFVKSYRYAVEKSEISVMVRSNPQIVVEHFKENLKTNKDLNNKTTEKVDINIRWLLIKSYLQKHFPIFIGVWLLGLMYFMFRFIGGMVHVNRIKYRRTQPVDELWAAKVRSFADKLNIKRTVLLVQSYMTQIPVTIGYLKPMILLPVSAMTGLSEQQIESIIAHELAHIMRRDYIFNIIQSIIEILFFYHPAVWWISSVIRNERENSCDDIAIQLTGDSLNYAKTLVIMQDQVINQESYAMAFGIKKQTLFKRVKRLLNRPTMKTNFIEGFIASCIIFAGILGLAFTSNSYSNTAFSAGVFLKPDSNNQSQKSSNDSTIHFSGDTLKNKTHNNSAQSKSGNNKSVSASPDIKSLLSDINEKGNISEEVKKELEVALSELDNVETVEILKGIQGALKEMDINAIVGEAMKGANAAINNMDVNAVVNEAMKANVEGKEMDVNKISKEAIKGASAALEAMDLNKIIDEAMHGVDGALKEIDLSSIINDAIEKETGKDEHDRDIDPNPEPEHHFLAPENKYYPIITKGTDEWNKWRTDNRNILPNLSGLQLKELNLREANLADLAMKEVSIKESDITGANLSGTFLIKANLKELKANEVNYQKSIANGAYFKENTMHHSDFTNANLKNAVFKECDLSGSSFKNADLRGASFIECNIENCNFKGAIANEKTNFPEGFNPAKYKIRFE